MSKSSLDLSDSWADPAASLEAYLADYPEALELPERADARVHASDARTAEALLAGGRQASEALNAWGAGFSGLVELSMRYHLPQVSRFFLRFFQFTRRWRGAAFDPPVTYCERLEDFIAARLEGYHLSPALKAAELEKLKAEDEALAREQGRGTLGIYLSGQGSYVNGWLYHYGRAGQPRDLLQANSPLMPRVLATAVHELLGHGLLAEFSALGAEKKAFGVQDWEYAQRFQFRDLDTPAQALLQEKLSLAHHGSRLLEEGWSTWIATWLPAALLNQPRRPRYTLAQVWDAAAAFPVGAHRQAAFRQALTRLFLEPPEKPGALLRHIRLMQQIALNWSFAQGLGQPPAYVVGALLLDRLETRLGLLNVPYALLIAANITYDLAKISRADLLSLLAGNPRFNPDWRLAALSTLDLPQPVTLSALAQAARDQLNLAVPDALID